MSQQTLVERLREYALSANSMQRSLHMNEAADRIEELERQLELEKIESASFRHGIRLLEKRIAELEAAQQQVAALAQEPIGEVKIMGGGGIIDGQVILGAPFYGVEWRNHEQPPEGTKLYAAPAQQVQAEQLQDSVERQCIHQFNAPCECGKATLCNGKGHPPASSQAEQEKDAARFAWYFSFEPAKDPSFLNVYMDGMNQRWNLQQWRAAIDAAMANSDKAGS
jgi:hypothetical protein